jgi:hypothetical protein
MDISTAPTDESGIEARDPDPAALQLVDEIYEEVFSAAVPPGEEAPFLRRKIEELDTEALGADFAFVRAALAAARDQFAGEAILQNVKDAKDSGRAKALFAQAAAGFADVGQPELVVRSEFFHAVASAAEANAALDLVSAQKHFAEAERLLSESEELGEGAAVLMEHLRPGVAFTEGLRRAQLGDHQGAELALQHASQASRHIAEAYYPEDSEEHRMFLAQSYFFLAYAELLTCNIEVGRFNFAAIAAKDDIAASARQAEALATDIAVPFVVQMGLMSSVIEQLLRVQQELSHAMVAMLKSDFAAAGTSFAKMRREIQVAREEAVRFGDQGRAMLGICDTMTTQVNNLERQMRPTPKDFGRFTGLVACVLFAVLFLMLSAVDYFLDSGVAGWQVIAASVVVALIGAFSYSAVRFKELLGFVAPGVPAVGGGTEPPAA